MVQSPVVCAHMFRGGYNSVVLARLAWGSLKTSLATWAVESSVFGCSHSVPGNREMATSSPGENEMLCKGGGGRG